MLVADYTEGEIATETRPSADEMTKAPREEALERAYDAIHDQVLNRLEMQVATTHVVREQEQRHRNERERNIDLLNFLGIAMTARLTMADVGLNSCGVFAGVTLGFLGFALFLLGIQGDMDVDASSEKYRVKIARMSPGALAIICATVLVAVSVLNRPKFSFNLLTPDRSAQPAPFQPVYTRAPSTVNSPSTSASNPSSIDGESTEKAPDETSSVGPAPPPDVEKSA